jgi:hypothetical protein
MSDAYERVSVRVLPDGRVSRADAAAYLGRKPKTLAAWIKQKRGPTPINSGGRIFYQLEELQRFASGDPAVAA